MLTTTPLFLAPYPTYSYLEPYIFNRMQACKILTCSLLLLLLTCAVVAAPSPRLTKAAVPTWVKASEKTPVVPDLADISEGYYFETIENQINLSTQTRFQRTVKVLTENAGAQHAGQIQIGFEPSYQTLVLHELYIVRAGQRLDRLALDKFQVMAYETELSRSIYNGTYSAYLPLEDLRKEDKIVLSYSLVGFNPVFGGKFFDKQALQSFEPIGLIHIRYIVPKERTLHIKSWLGAPQAVKTDLGGSVAYQWEIAGSEKADFEPSTPFWHSTIQRIECSEYDTWSDVAQWAAEVNPIPALPKNSSLARYIDAKWAEAKEDSLTYAQLVADFVQNEIRYMGIEVGEYSHRANSPEKVFAQRYGDCKDKSVLMAAMLKHKGIMSRLVLVNSYEEYKLDEYLPSPAAFNHMTLHFTIDGRGQFIDPTMTNQGGPFRERYFPFYGKVLLAEPKAKLHLTSKHLTGSIRIEERFHLQKDGSATLDVLTVYKGSDADQIRAYFEHTAKNQTEKSYLEYYQRLYNKTSKRAPLTYQDDVAQNLFQVHESYTIGELVELDPLAHRPAVSLYASNLSSSLPSVTGPRSGPISLPYPLSMEHVMYVINPDGVHVPISHGTLNTQRESYYFGRDIVSQGDTMKVTFVLGTHDTYVHPAETHHYLSDFSDLNNVFSCAVYLDDDGFLTGSNTQNQTNWWAVLAFVGLLGLLTAATARYYHHRKASSLITLYEEREYDKIGGWLILLAIGLFFSPFRIFFTMMTPVFFSEQVWATLGYNIGVSPAVYGTILIAEFAANTILIFLCGYCFYLLVKKRDIFPQTLFATLMFQLLVVVADMVASQWLLKNLVADSADTSEVIRAFLSATIWGLYLFNSTRVKGTFVAESEPEIQGQDDDTDTATAQVSSTDE